MKSDNSDELASVALSGDKISSRLFVHRCSWFSSNWAHYNLINTDTIKTVSGAVEFSAAPLSELCIKRSATQSAFANYFVLCHAPFPTIYLRETRFRTQIKIKSALYDIDCLQTLTCHVLYQIGCLIGESQKAWTFQILCVLHVVFWIWGRRSSKKKFGVARCKKLEIAGLDDNCDDNFNFFPIWSFWDA